MAVHLTVADLAGELQIDEATVYQLRNRNPDALPPGLQGREVPALASRRRRRVDRGSAADVERDVDRQPTLRLDRQQSRWQGPATATF